MSIGEFAKEIEKMEDRYLFKAKRADNGEWVTGYYTKSIVNGSVFGYIRESIFGTDIKIMLNTLCQYTGLNDKNGKLIWENDVVKEFNSCGDEWNLSQIVFADYSLNLGWCAKGIKTLHEYNHRLFNVGFEKNKASKCEVIGNIFDNPELLEGGE